MNFAETLAILFRRALQHRDFNNSDTTRILNLFGHNGTKLTSGEQVTLSVFKNTLLKSQPQNCCTTFVHDDKPEAKIAQSPRPEYEVEMHLLGESKVLQVPVPFTLWPPFHVKQMRI